MTASTVTPTSRGSIAPSAAASASSGWIRRASRPIRPGPAISPIPAAPPIWPASSPRKSAPRPANTTSSERSALPAECKPRHARSPEAFGGSRGFQRRCAWPSGVGCQIGLCSSRKSAGNTVMLAVSTCDTDLCNQIGTPKRSRERVIQLI